MSVVQGPMTRSQAVAAASIMSDRVKQVMSLFDKVEKLQGTENYKMWAYRIKAALATIEKVEFLEKNSN